MTESLNRYHKKLISLTASSLLFGALIVLSPELFAQSQSRLSDDMIPPDVTLTDKVSVPQAQVSSTTAPGMAGAAGGAAHNPEVPAFTGSNPQSSQSAFSGIGGPKNPFNNPMSGQIEQLIKQGGNKVDVQKLMELQKQMQNMPMQQTQPGQAKNPTAYSMQQSGQMQPGQMQNSAIGQGSQSKDPVAVLETSKGTIVIRLFRNFAPKTVQAFSSMAQEGFYNGLNFHRYEPGFVIQGGCPQGNGRGLYIDRNTGKPRMLALEVTPALRHNAPGVVAMARSPGDLNSASCQFYITLGPKSQLDQQYTIFGGVVRGMEVVNNIRVGDKIINVQVQEQD